MGRLWAVTFSRLARLAVIDGTLVFSWFVEKLRRRAFFFHEKNSRAPAVRYFGYSHCHVPAPVDDPGLLLVERLPRGPGPDGSSHARPQDAAVGAPDAPHAWHPCPGNNKIPTIIVGPNLAPRCLRKHASPPGGRRKMTGFARPFRPLAGPRERPSPQAGQRYARRMSRLRARCCLHPDRHRRAALGRCKTACGDPRVGVSSQQPTGSELLSGHAASAHRWRICACFRSHLRPPGRVPAEEWCGGGANVLVAPKLYMYSTQPYDHGRRVKCFFLK